MIDITDIIADAGKEKRLVRHFIPDNSLLPYPQASFTDVELHFDVTFVKPDVNVVGDIVCRIQGFCDRCLASVSREITLPFDQTFYKDEASDEDSYVYYGSKLDVTKAVCDEIILSLPTGLLCKEDCKGLCPKCGADLNKQQCGCDASRENAFSALKDLKF